MGVGRIAAGLAVNAQGDRLVVANLYSDSLSIIDLQNRTKLHKIDLRPGKIDPSQSGVPGGQYPFWVVIQGNDKAYVSSQRDREIVVLNIATPTPAVVGRIAISGQPNKLILNKAETVLFAAVDNSDTVVMIDTASNQILKEITTTAPNPNFPNPTDLKGSNPNSLTLSPDERTLYVTNGGTNSVAVIQLPTGRDGKVFGPGRVIGLIPTGWYPNSVSMLRAIKDILYIKPLGLNDGLAEPMADVFDKKQQEGSYTAIVPEILRTTALPLPAQTAQNSLLVTAKIQSYARPRHDAVYWTEKTKGLFFNARDHLDTVRFNRVLWAGLKGEDVPYPLVHHGKDLSKDRHWSCSRSTRRCRTTEGRFSFQR